MAMALLVGATPAVFLAVAVARGGIANPWTLPLAVLTLCANILIVLMDLRYGLALFILTAGLSPKLPGFYNNLRIEDFVFVLVFGIWLLKALQAGKFPRVSSPIVLPFVVLTILSLVSTLWGFGIGTIPDWKYSLFLQMKRIEYFLIFWVVATTIRSDRWLFLLTIVFVASGALAALYGLAHPISSVGQSVAETRVSGPEGENYNTLAGYLVVCIGVGLATAAGVRKPLPRLLLMSSTAIAVLGLLFSFSREGYVMLVGSLLVFAFTRQRLIILGVGAALLALILFAAPIRDNFGNAAKHIQESPGGNVGSNSLSARYSAWNYRWNGWFIKQPLIGNGVGAVSLTVDNEYLLRACEVGLIGFAAFLWWLVAIARQVKRLQSTKGFAHLLAVGLAAGFVGLLIQGLVAASFTTIRTMEPFWFLLGMVAAAAMSQIRAGRETEIRCAS
jgi:hypothetical protein